MTFSPIMTIAMLIFLLAALIGTTVSAVMLYRLRRDVRWVEEAERHERVDLQYLIKRYVPLDHMTGMAMIELPIAKQNIARLLRFWKPIGAASTTLCIVGVILLTIALRHELPAGRIEAEPNSAASVNPMADIIGTWGTPYDFALSCSQNPHTIKLLNEGRQIAVAFAKPPGPAIPQSFELSVAGTQKNEIILSIPNRGQKGLALPYLLSIPKWSRTQPLVMPLRLELILDDKNTYHLIQSDQPMAIFDMVARCPPDHASEVR